MLTSLEVFTENIAMNINQEKFIEKKQQMTVSRPIPKWVRYFLYIFSLYLVLPVIDVPLLGLSISAPIFFFIAVFCIIKPPYPWFRRYSNWIILAVLIWFGIFISTTFNGIFSQGVNISGGGVLAILRFTYWLIVFVITVFIASQENLIQKIAELLGWGVMFLALIRWGEIILFGNINAIGNTYLFSQNTYGFQFSTFSPFILMLIPKYRKGKRIFYLIGLILVWTAAAINGSRSSWVAIGIGFALYLLLILRHHPKKIIAPLLSVIFVGGATALLISSFPDISTAFMNRFSTLENLDADRSYATRVVMNQKSIKLFLSSPIIGIGATRYRQESVDLEIPDVLKYVSQEKFNQTSAHNSYLSFLAENGLVGIIPLAILIITLGLKGYRRIKNLLSSNQYWSLAVFLSFIQMSIHMWTLATFSNTEVWFIYGLMGALIMTESKKPQIRKEV